MSKEIIGIIGPIGAGKDEAGDYISKKLNIPSFQISYPLKQICADEGVEPTRDNLIALGTKLANEHGDGYLAEYLVQKMPDKAIVTGMRQLGQIAVFKTCSNFKLISIDASPEIRFERIKQQAKLGEADTLEEFISREKAENSSPNAQRLFECMDLADYQIVNENTLDDLHLKIDEILKI